ncbi:MAG: bifunctional 3,4-dihydroxy-2-butanone-4-phosphate synthase/GTP cyclohydrolase II [Proteobacteria bacterium]|nr:MAG: bifunctional 3,4-dihydroxy-2-butanone-4-phosphate synthase/GTP cyclohydrolase II [Pseudomonadota bacterium]
MPATNSKHPVERALEQLANGRMIILVDDEDRENEGDLVLAAEFATAENINFLARHARGLICLTLEGKRVDELRLPAMAPINRANRSTAFTVSIEAREGISTGISAADRAHTIRTAVDPLKGASDIVSPGHIFPLRAAEGGVLVRAGHTEGSVDLCRMAGLRPAAVICEIMNEDGTMARMPDLEVFAEAHSLPILTIKDLIEWRIARESLIEQVAVTDLPTVFGAQHKFRLHAYRSLTDGSEHIAMVSSRNGKLENPALVRVHSECLTGDALGSLRCDCGPQLQAALKQISESGNGVLVYMRQHEGRGIGLINKIKAYALQDQGLDTVEANRHLGFPADLRHYGMGAQILRHLGVSEMKLLTNNPRKVVSLEGFGLKITEQLPIEMDSNPANLAYLTTKRDKLGHSLKVKKDEQ